MKTLRDNWNGYVVRVCEGAPDPLCDALRLVLLFHDGGPWTEERSAEWARITGGREATTRVLCDHVRSVLGEDA